MTPPATIPGEPALRQAQGEGGEGEALMLSLLDHAGDDGDVGPAYLAGRGARETDDVIERARQRVGLVSPATDPPPGARAAGVQSPLPPSGEGAPDFVLRQAQDEGLMLSLSKHGDGRAPFAGAAALRQAQGENDTGGVGITAGNVARDIGEGVIEAPLQIVGGVRDAAQNSVVAAVNALGDFLESKFPLAVCRTLG